MVTTTAARGPTRCDRSSRSENCSAWRHHGRYSDVYAARMSSMRHRQRFGWVRALSSLVPVLTVLSAGAALVLNSPALAVVAMVIGSLGTITLYVLVTRVQRQARRDVASTRAEAARAYAEQHTRTVREHREFSAHVGERLEQATNEEIGRAHV